MPHLTISVVIDTAVLHLAIGVSKHLIVIQIKRKNINSLPDAITLHRCTLVKIYV